MIRIRKKKVRNSQSWVVMPRTLSSGAWTGGPLKSILPSPWTCALIQGQVQFQDVDRPLP